MDEDSDKITMLADSDRARTFSPSRRPSFQPWSRTNTIAATGSGTGNANTSTGFQRPSSSGDREPLLRRQRSRQTSVDSHSILLERSAGGSARRNGAMGNGGGDESEDSGTEQWHSIALIFVAAPAMAGMFFENGSAVMTDVLMLGLGCLFLYWSVKWPWQWYYSTQEMKLADLDPNAEFAVLEDSDVDELDSDAESSRPREVIDGTNGPDQAASSTSPPNRKPHQPSRASMKRTSAAKALQTLEIMALASCFLSPGAVAYMLHSIRPYLSRPSGGVVSNSNLTLFVLAAELRPVLHFFRLVEERTLHLQRIVSSLPASEEKQLEDQVSDLLKRIEDMESTTSKPSASTTDPAEKKDPFSSSSSTTTITTTTDLEKSLRSSLQPQLDALNRAVRRYEKRATTQAIVTEARLQDLEARLKDALSLAAAASRQSQKQEGGLFAQLSTLILWVLTKPVEAARTAVMVPVVVAGETWKFLFGPRRARRRKGQGGGGGSSGGGGMGEGRKWASEFRGKSCVEGR